MTKGIWFYGLAGAGKTFASKQLSSIRDRSFLIDGDRVRKHISTDLGYTESERLIQISRVLGLSVLAIENGYFPIASTVFMNQSTYSEAKKKGIQVIEIKREVLELKSTRNFYGKNEENVVGESIPLPSLQTKKLMNCGTNEFCDLIKNL